MESFSRITRDSSILGGRACIRGLRISAALVVRLVANGMTPGEIAVAHPDLEAADVEAALRYAAWLAEEETLPSATYPLVLRKARDEERILLAHDLDFADLLAASSDLLPSVIVFRLRDMRPTAVAAALTSTLAQLGDVLKDGAFVGVTETRARFRRLPLG